ncbi:MAG: thiamine-phosphate kinase [Candidatus Brocadiia bacterium]
MGWRERPLLELFRKRALSDPSVPVGPGDDCALLLYGGKPVAVTTDMIEQDVDFRAVDSPYKVGWKAIMISASDLVATGCRPKHFLVASKIPREWDSERLDLLLAGLYDACERLGASLVGGDISAGSPLLLVSTGLGEPWGDAPILRSGARPGDDIFVSGPLGGSILGRHLEFVPRMAFGEELACNGLVTAMMDISDGLSGDLLHIADCSNVDFTVIAQDIPIHEDAVALSSRDGILPIVHALSDGEDFELLFTAPPDSEQHLIDAASKTLTPLRRIGTITPAGTGRSLFINGENEPWRVTSYEH